MILDNGCIRSIDAAGIDLDGSWLLSTVDVYAIDYSTVLEQPINLVGDTLTALRFKAAPTTITIWDTVTCSNRVLWMGTNYLAPDPVPTVPDGGTGTVTSVGISVSGPLGTSGPNPITGAGTIAIGWTGTGTNLVLDNGTVIPESSFLPPTCYYYSTLPTTVANTVTSTTLVPGITAFQITDQVPGSPVRITGNGTIRWNSLADYITWTFVDGSTTLATFTIVGTDLKVGSALTPYMWELDLQINYLTAQSSTASVQLIGTLTVYDDYVVLPISINTTTVVDTTPINTLHVNVQWSTANANDIFVADYFKVAQNSVTAGATITAPSVDYDGGQANSIYGGAIVINGGNA
jgi:hypothetical protein